MIGALVGLTTLFDWFQEKVDKPPPPIIDARIESAKLQLRNERLIDYLRDTNQDLTGLTRREQREKGLRFSVRVRLRGEQGIHIPLRWQMYHAGEEGGRLGGPIYSQTKITFTPINSDHARTVPVWIPYPPEPGRYSVIFALIDRKRQPLDEATVAFAARSIPKLDG